MCFLIFPTFKAWGGYSKAAAEQRMGDFNSQGLANAAWAFATADQSDASMFAALATAAKQHMGDFNSQGLANVAWAFVAEGRNDGSLVAATAMAAEQCMGSLNPADLLNVRSQ